MLVIIRSVFMPTWTALGRVILQITVLLLVIAIFSVLLPLYGSPRSNQLYPDPVQRQNFKYLCYYHLRD
jgi:hypothetical protein